MRSIRVLSQAGRTARQHAAQTAEAELIDQRRQVRWNRRELSRISMRNGVNGRRPTLTNNDAYDLVIAVADGALDAVDQIAARLARAASNGDNDALCRRDER